jgi:hypothetical protein
MPSSSPIIHHALFKNIFLISNKEILEHISSGAKMSLLVLLFCLSMRIRASTDLRTSKANQSSLNSTRNPRKLNPDQASP